jgi:hypothetical protein
VKLTIIAISFFALELFPFISCAQAAPAMRRPIVYKNANRPKLAPTNFVAIPFPSPHPSGVGNVVFAPNGTAYFTDADNELASFTPVASIRAYRCRTRLKATNYCMRAASFG